MRARRETALPRLLDAQDEFCYCVKAGPTVGWGWQVWSHKLAAATPR
jgi:hypothetical protein